MNKLKTIINDMVIISTAMVLGLGIQEMIIHFTRGIRSFEMPWYIPLTIPFVSLLCALPSVLMSDIDELSKNQIRLRVCLHFVCLWLVVTICGALFEWYSLVSEYMSIMLVFVIIYVGVWMLSWWLGKRDENIINEALQRIHDKE